MSLPIVGLPIDVQASIEATARQHRQEVERLEAQIDGYLALARRLRNDLLAYGGHLQCCLRRIKGNLYDCTCGFESAKGVDIPSTENADDEPRPDHIDEAILRIISEYPAGTPVRYMKPLDQETILALQAIPRRKA